MQKQNSGIMKDIPILTGKELSELEKIMYSHQDDELLERRFWKDVYKKRGLEYKKD